MRSLPGSCTERLEESPDVIDLSRKRSVWPSRQPDDIANDCLPLFRWGTPHYGPTIVIDGGLSLE